MNKQTTNPATTANEPAPESLGNRRKAAIADIIIQIDLLLSGSTLTAAEAEAAPTTFAFICALDGPATGPRSAFGVRVKQFPPQIFSRYDPEEKILGYPHRHDFGRLVFTGPETLAALIASAASQMGSTEILTIEEIAILRDLQAKFSAISPQFAKFSNQASAEEFHQQKQRLIANTLKTGALPAALIRTHESISGEFTTARNALLELQLLISHQAYPLVLKAYAKTFKIIRRMMVYFEESERLLAADFCLPWQPSWLWKACAGIQCRRHPSLLADNVGDPVSPSSLLEGIVKL